VSSPIGTKLIFKCAKGGRTCSQTLRLTSHRQTPANNRAIGSVRTVAALRFDAVRSVKLVHRIESHTQAPGWDDDVNMMRILDLGPRCFELAFVSVVHLGLWDRTIDLLIKSQIQSKIGPIKSSMVIGFVAKDLAQSPVHRSASPPTRQPHYRPDAIDDGGPCRAAP
jgi:hypothetical protein